MSILPAAAAPRLASPAFRAAAARRARTALALCAALAAAGCGTSGDGNDSAAAARPIVFPSNRAAQSAACYAARLARTDATGGKQLTVEEVSEAAQYLLLGATEAGITEPNRANALRDEGLTLVDRIRANGQADSLLRQCQQAFSATRPGAFVALPADTPGARQQCYGLGFAIAQIAGNSPDVARDARLTGYLKMTAALDERVAADARAAGTTAPELLLQDVKRGLARALEAGPVTAVLDACSQRYGVADATG